MKFNVVTIFPEIIRDYMNHGLISRAQKNKLLEISLYNPRDFSEDKHGRIDDKPFGGGSGMLFKAEPIIHTINKVKEINDTHVIFVAPHGKIFDQNKAEELKNKENLTFICGRYEGIDKRIEEECVDEVISIGDYVLNGGELAALVIIEAISRFLKSGDIIVIPIITYEVLEKVSNRLRLLNYETSMNLIQTFKGISISEGTRFEPNNPVFIIKAKKK